MKYVIFNRLRNEVATGSDPFIFEFEKPIEFNIINESKLYNDLYNITLDSDIPPAEFYNMVLGKILELYQSNSLHDCRVFTKCEEDSFNEYIKNKLKEENKHERGK